MPQPASRGLAAFSGLMDAMSALDGPRASAGRLSNASSQSWDSRSAAANAAGVQTLPAAWPGATLGGGNPLFGGLDARVALQCAQEDIGGQREAHASPAARIAKRFGQFHCAPAPSPGASLPMTPLGPYEAIKG